jgi:predicted GNAT family acetyltransferase
MITAVEWLVSQLNKKGFAQVVTDEEIEQAKEMEKEQNEKYNELKEVIEDMIKHLDEGRVLTLRKDSVIVEALRNSINN